jgi:hypothetical protein
MLVAFGKDKPVLAVPAQKGSAVAHPVARV